MEVEDADLGGIRSERDFMDALRVLKARSGLSYRDIVTRMSRADPRHASARSTLADLLAGNSLPRRPGQLSLLLKVLAAELDEPGQVGRYMQAWSRLIATRGNAEPPGQPAAPVVSGPAAPAPVLSRPATWPAGSVPLYVRSPGPSRTPATPPDEAPSGGRRVGVVLLWLVLSLIYYPAAHVIGWLFWLIWLAYTIPLLVIVFAPRNGGRRSVNLLDAPSEYLRAEYRTSRPGAPSRLAGRWPG